MKVYLKQLELGPLQNFVYLIGSPESRQTAVVDPAWDVPRILETAQQDEMRITHAIITHTHFDHINGLEPLLEALDIQVVVHKKEADALPIDPSRAEVIEGGQEISLGGVTLSFLHTPGHSPGSICVATGDLLLTGDTLFVGGCGRCDLPGSDPEAMYKSLTRLSQLDEQMVIHPGHNYANQPTALLAEEKSYNPFLQAESLNQFLTLVGSVRRK